MTVEQTKGLIVDIVRGHWLSKHSALLISEVGSQLSADRKIELQRLTGLKLQPFILQQMADVLQIVPRPGHPDFFGLFPLDAQLNSDLRQYFAFGSSASALRFNARFWAAFSVPLGANARRFIRLEDLLFFDQSATELPPGDHLEIERSLIPDADAPERAKKIEKNIADWCSVNKLDPNRFALRPQREVKATLPESDSILHALVSLLSSSELARVSMPLDIVAKLLRHSGK